MVASKTRSSDTKEPRAKARCANFTYTVRSGLRVAGASRLQRPRVEVNDDGKQSLEHRVTRHVSAARQGNDCISRLICSDLAPTRSQFARLVSSHSQQNDCQYCNIPSLALPILTPISF